LQSGAGQDGQAKVSRQLISKQYVTLFLKQNIKYSQHIYIL
jgi:hypothetical protein